MTAVLVAVTTLYVGKSPSIVTVAGALATPPVSVADRPALAEIASSLVGVAVCCTVLVVIYVYPGISKPLTEQ